MGYYVPTSHEKEVLLAAKEFYGRTWRNKVYTAWMTGSYQGFPRAAELQEIRNDQFRTWTIDRVVIS